jgi:hypothetical protein
VEVLLSEIAARETVVTARVGVGNVRRSSRNAALIAGRFGTRGFLRRTPARLPAAESPYKNEASSEYVPRWRNGRRSGLKIHRGQPHAGSSPALGIKNTPNRWGEI